ncbi:MAG: addiction module toxin, RelE/StbE family [Gammaproteobacteria bacterium]|nr:addiction module toxin, RelE/StbE family [Gammaproteobacteria bacterium]
MAAVKTVLHILKSVEILVNHPSASRPGRLLETRELIINGTPYIIPYRIKKGQIEILRVFHAAMQWPKPL